MDGRIGPSMAFSPLFIARIPTLLPWAFISSL